MKSFFLFLLMLVGLNAQAQAQGLVPDQTEFDALKDLYEDLEGEDWFDKTNWPSMGSWPSSATAAQMGTWYGITVANGDVVGINLYENNVKGTLPSSIGQLTQLLNINLGYNTIHGSISGSINNLTLLKELTLYYNAFEGVIPDLSALTQLESLQLSNNHNLTAGPIPFWIGTLPHLRGLALVYTNRSGAIPTNFNDLTELEYLDLSSNGLDGPIPEWIGDLTKLQYLNLNTNPWTGAIPASICKLTDLEYLQIANTGTLMGGIPDQIGNLTKLKILSLWGTNLKGPLPASINKLHQLEQLQLFQTQFSGPLPKMDQMTSLSYLYIYFSQFSGSIDFLTTLPALNYVSLSGNHFSGKIPTGLPAGIHHLDLNYNSFTGTLPSDLARLTQLQTLYVANSNLSGNIPSSLDNMNNLLFVDLSGNDFTGIDAGAYSRASRGNLVWQLNGNRLEFSHLEPLMSNGPTNATYFLTPQKAFKEPAHVGYKANELLTLPLSYSKTSNTSISWEKQSGSDWIDVSANNQDETSLSYKRNSTTSADEGTYRWKMTNSTVSGALYSTLMKVKTSMEIAIDQYTFQYKYDGRKRMTHKKVPGADWLYMVYDDRDRLVLTQDGNQRLNNQWLFTKYDALNRPVQTGIYTHPTAADQLTMQDAVNTSYAALANAGKPNAWYETFSFADNHQMGYDNQSFPYENLEILTVTFYDNYDFVKPLMGPHYGYVDENLSQIANGQEYKQPDLESTRVIGQITGTKVKNLTNGSWLNTVSYYDEKYRAVQLASDNNVYGVDRTTNVFDFVGKVLESKTTHSQNTLKWSETNSSPTPTSIVSNVGNNWYVGAFSMQSIPANTDGSIAWTVSGLSSQGSFGLSEINSGGHYLYISYSIMQLNHNLQIYEYDNPQVSFGEPVASFSNLLNEGDVLKIVREGEVIKYYRNTDLIHTSTRLNNKALHASAALKDKGAAIQNIRTSFVPEQSRSIDRIFTYDHAGRLLTTHHGIDGATPVLLAKNEYNELGQLIDKKLHSTDNTKFKQSTDYRYNIRGWLTSINNAELTPGSNNEDDSQNMGRDLFGMELAYEKPVTGLTTNDNLQYNGNISAITYSNNLALGAIKSNGYKFDYDPLNRLKESNFRQKKSGTWDSSEYVIINEQEEQQIIKQQAFSETGIDYDLNGNIKALQRSGIAGSQKMDDLGYVYEGNQLMSVNEKNGADKEKGFIDGNVSGDDYRYDANGNMVSDANKSIANIAYNYLNLPEKVTKTSGEYIQYQYDATGGKLSQQVYDPSNVLIKKSDYAGEYFYENDTLKFIHHEEGRVVINRDPGPAELVASFDGSDPSAFVLNASIPGTLSSEQQGGQTYLKFTSATFHWAGPLTKSVPVEAGETYKLRTQGYTTQPDVYVYIMGGDGSDVLWPGANFPLGASNETWMENTFTVPAGMDHVYLGAIFGDAHPGSGDAFYINTIELYKLTNPTPTISNEYQYNLKDHLGNVRTTFTTKEEIEETLATLESQYENTERNEYLKYDDARRVFDVLFDHTNGDPLLNPTTVPGYSLRLNGSENERNGIARSLSVMPGDKIDMQVFGKFIDPNTPHTDQTAWDNLAAFALNVASAAQTVVIDGAGYTSGTLRLPPHTGVLTDPNESTAFPKAHLNWAIFDRDWKFLDGGARQLQGGAEDGTDVLFGKITSSIDINEPGYVYIWLSNTDASQRDVYFDDFSVKHIKSPVVQQEEFYPFGLTFNSYQKENGMENHFLFNGKERQDELGLEWLDFGARMYMPEIGRWGVIDPLAETSRRWSPYNYAYDNPIRFIDPDGMKADDFGNVTYNGFAGLGEGGYIGGTERDAENDGDSQPCKCSSYNEKGDPVTYGDPSKEGSYSPGNVLNGFKTILYILGFGDVDSPKEVSKQKFGVTIWGTDNHPQGEEFGSKKVAENTGGLDLRDPNNILSVFSFFGNTHAVGTWGAFDAVFDSDPREDYYGNIFERVYVWHQDEKTGLYSNRQEPMNGIYNYYEYKFEDGRHKMKLVERYETKFIDSELKVMRTF